GPEGRPNPRQRARSYAGERRCPATPEPNDPVSDVAPEGPQASAGERASASGPVLAVFAHPDDAEIAAGGTLGKWASEGRQVHLLVLTNGDRGSQDASVDRAELARVRLEETQAAASMLGLAGAEVLGVHDGELANTPEVRAEVVRSIR